MQALLPAFIIDERALVNHVVTHSLDLEVNQLIQVLYLFQPQLVVHLAFCVMLQYGVLGQHITLIHAVLSKGRRAILPLQVNITHYVGLLYIFRVRDSTVLSAVRWPSLLHFFERT